MKTETLDLPTLLSMALGLYGIKTDKRTADIIIRTYEKIHELRDNFSIIDASKITEDIK